MNYEILTIIVGFTSLAVIMNRNTAALMSELDGMQEEIRQRLKETQNDTNTRIESIGTLAISSRTEMHELVQRGPEP